MGPENRRLFRQRLQIILDRVDATDVLIDRLGELFLDDWVDLSVESGQFVDEQGRVIFPNQAAWDRFLLELHLLVVSQTAMALLDVLEASGSKSPPSPE